MGRIVYALLSMQGTAMSETALCLNCHADLPERQLTITQARRSGDWNGGGFVDCSRNQALHCTGCGHSNFTREGIRGYTYKADTYCPEHIVQQIDGQAPTEGPWAEDKLDYCALMLGFDREDESSFDSGDFPKTILTDHSEPQVCGECGVEF